MATSSDFGVLAELSGATAFDAEADNTTITRALGVRASEGGRVYTTALMTIGMQVYNRYGRLAF